MSTFWGSQVNRRAFLTAGAVAAPMLATQFVDGQGSDPEIEGDCEDESSVQMLVDWREGKVVYPTLGDSTPQPDWVEFDHPTIFVPYLIPPDWTGVALWADSFTRDGEPEWQESQLYLPQLTASRIISPDGDAIFEYAVGSLQQVLLNTQDCASIAKQSIVGADPDLRQVCMIDDQYNALSPNWFTVDRQSSNLLITSGNAMQLPHDIAPATVVSFTSVYGPRSDMDDLMYDVFLRILFQFLGGGSDDPTPTSTP